MFFEIEFTTFTPRSSNLDFNSSLEKKDSFPVIAIFLPPSIEVWEVTFSASSLKPKLIISSKNLILSLSEKNACRLDEATSPISSTAIKSSTEAEKIFSIFKNLFDKFFEVSRPISLMPKAYIKLLNLMFLLLY